MGVFEYVRRWAVDADIVIDFQRKQVAFQNEKNLFRDIKGLIVLSAQAIFLFALFLLPFGFLESFGVAVGWICFSLLTELSLGFQPLRSLYFKMKRRPRRQLTIQNPEGSLKYETRSGMPFFDLEFPRSVGKQLQTVSLLKNSRKTSLLKVEILGKASGDLVIKEF